MARHRPNRFPRALLLLFVVLLAPLPAPADDISIALQDAGHVVLPDAALQDRDFLIAVYAQRPEDLALPSLGQTELPGTLPLNCLPLVQINTASGAPRLNAAGEVSFGCRDLPPGTGVFAMRNGRWEPVATHRTQEGLIATRFVETAVFGVFLLPENELSRI